MVLSTIEIIDRLTNLVIFSLDILRKISGQTKEEVLESIKKAEVKTDELLTEWFKDIEK
jgi:hypothetical protein